MKNKFSLASVNHSNAKRMEYFLNSLEVELKEISFEWNTLKRAERMETALRYKEIKGVPLMITVFFCDSYADANEIAEENNFPYTLNAKWGVNGDLLYLVESEEPELVSDILGHFAGKE